MDLGAFYDIEKVKVEWKENKKVAYRIDVATDSRSWYVAADPGSKTFESAVHEFDITDTYRRYVRIALRGEKSSLEDIQDVQVLAAKSLSVPEVLTGPETMGYARPVIRPLPASVSKMEEPVKSLAGTWKFNLNPGKEFWENSADFSKWNDVKVPGSPEIQGYNVRLLEDVIEWHYPKKNVETAYKKKISIPKEYKGKKIFLRFESAFSFARIWVNGVLVRVHRGGYATFDCDITEYVIPGEDALITVGLTAEVNTPEYSLGRGLLGDVKLIALSRQHITRLHVETNFDDGYRNATLKVMSGLDLGGEDEGSIQLKLKDAKGNGVKIEPAEIKFTDKNPEAEVVIPVTQPHQWDAEHPYLYTLEASVVKNGEVLERVEKKVGFREVQVAGNKLLVNGSEVKLKGVNWVNVSPSEGAAANYASDKESLLKLKAANVNMIRTSHFPQYDYVYDICDELGIYVEEEASVMMVSKWVETHFERYEAKEDSAFEDWYVMQYAEMIEKDRSHPSIIYYSLGNESDWGLNIKKGRDYVKSMDTTRPVKFSWGYTVPEGETDIFSVHYPETGEFYTARQQPTIYDEYAHLYCNNVNRIEKDPALRDIYGYAIQKQWNMIYLQDGGLGGAIWHSRDYNFFGPNGIWPGFTPKWGLLDIWNREKPEYWHVKKAYSPVKIREDKVYQNPGTGKELILPVENRYFHTNLNELVCEWSVGSEKGRLQGPDVAPMRKGDISIPGRNWADGDLLQLKWIRPDDVIQDFVADEYAFVIGGEAAPVFDSAKGPAPVIQENSTDIKITGKGFDLAFDKATGKVASGIYDSENLIIGGPDINLGIDVIPSNWTCKSIQARKDGEEAVVIIDGRYSSFDNVHFEIRIDGTGRMKVDYEMDLPKANIDELGVSFQLTKDIYRIDWKRKADLWTVYPQDHIARLSGTAYRDRSEGEETYGVKPEWPWVLDLKEFMLGKTQNNWRGTRDFRASKHDIYYAAVSTKKGNGITAESDGSGSVRATPESDGSVKWVINNEWGSTGVDEFKRYDIPVSVTSGHYSGSVVIRLTKQEDMK